MSEIKKQMIYKIIMIHTYYRQDTYDTNKIQYMHEDAIQRIINYFDIAGTELVCARMHN